jgi:hypothetical protein
MFFCALKTIHLPRRGLQLAWFKTRPLEKAMLPGAWPFCWILESVVSRLMLLGSGGELCFGFGDDAESLVVCFFALAGLVPFLVATG